jgi:hypothetical protein
MKTLSLKLPEALDRQLAAAVAKRGISKNDLVREALAAYLGRTEEAEMEPSLTLAGKLVGCVEGPHDLSTHPRYLEDFGK